MTKQPSYRFEAYTEAWEEKKLGEVAELLNGRAYKQEELLEYGEYRVLRVGNFNTNDRWYYSDLQLEDSKYANYGDLLYLWATNFGPELWKEEKVIYHYHIWKISGYSNILDKYYFYTFLEKDKNSIKQNTNGSTMVHITKGMMEERVLTFPCLPEQNAIGSFFQDIDQLISLQQRKLEVLKEQKKTYLKLLFPSKGQTKPALRFAGFEDEWKEVKLGDLILRGGSGGTPKSTVAKYYGGDIPFLSITDISNSGKYLKKTEKTITNEGLQNSSAWVVPEGAISLAMYASVGKLAILGIDCATSQAFYNMVFEDDIVRNFVYITLEKANIYNEWGSLISTGTQANLNAEKVKNFSFLHPSSSEQEAIGSFFQDLDKAIAKQEEKVNQIKESKQTLLRKMFI